MHDGLRTRLLLANMTAAPCVVRVERLGVPAAHIRRLDEESFERATLHAESFRQEVGEPHQLDGTALDLSLRPYAVVRIDLVAGG
jgi:hypothetical protein